MGWIITSPTNCKLQLLPQMKIHPVFHNSLLKPYIETSTHGPNFARPPPEIVGGEEGHYKIEKILQERPTRNKKSTQYLVKWKGYPGSVLRSGLSRAPIFFSLAPSILFPPTLTLTPFFSHCLPRPTYQLQYLSRPP